MTQENGQTDQPQALKLVLAEFTDQESLLEAAQQVRDDGYRRWDSYSPFPVHGIERAMGMRSTILPWLVLMAGIGGGVVAFGLQWWTNAFDYPHNISGKPLFSLPANIPVVFELIVLFSAATAFIGALALNNLPRFSHPLFSQDHFRRATKDRFFIAIEAADPLFDEAKVRALFDSAGAASVEAVYGPAESPKIPLAVHLFGLVVVLVAMIPPLWIARDRSTKSDSPRVHPVPDMDYQPKFKTQAATTLFADGRTMRPPLAGTIAQGNLRDDDHLYRGMMGDQFADALPEQLKPVTMALMERGRQRYDIYCATCHGLAGAGDGVTSQRALGREDSAGWVPPLSLHTQAVREQPVGKIFNTITNGIRTMPGYAAQVGPEDRWAIVLYVLALQRSQNAALDDLPPEEREALELRELK